MDERMKVRILHKARRGKGQRGYIWHINKWLVEVVRGRLWDRKRGKGRWENECEWKETTRDREGNEEREKGGRGNEGHDVQGNEGKGKYEDVFRESQNS